MHPVALISALSLLLAPLQAPTRDRLPAPPAGKVWQLAWHDEFDGAALDETRWQIPPDAPRRDGWWMRSAISLDGRGHLAIRAHREGDRYVAGCVRSRGKFEHVRGFYIARLRMHALPGHWPAFWLYNDCVCKDGNGGRDGAEIDIVEKPWLDGRIGHAIHWDGYWENHRCVDRKVDVPGVMQGWHTYAVWWSDTAYIFYVDGVETWRTDAGGICEAPLYVKLTDEIGTWGGDIRTSPLPDEFLVDYVRVYDLADR